MNDTHTDLLFLHDVGIEELCICVSNNHKHFSNKNFVYKIKSKHWSAIFMDQNAFVW